MKHIQPSVLLIVIFVVSYLFGCEKADYDEEFNAKIGQNCRIYRGLSFRIDSLRDYRCPLDVFCAWSGDVDVYLTIDGCFQRTDTVLNLNNRRTNPSEFDNYLFKILDVQPHLKIGEMVEQEDIRIILNVSRK